MKQRKWLRSYVLWRNAAQITSCFCIIAASIGGKEVIIQTDVVEYDIPLLLLLREATIKTAGAKNDLTSDAANNFCKRVILFLKDTK